jgi:hypothetical protein
MATTQELTEALKLGNQHSLDWNARTLADLAAQHKRRGLSSKQIAFAMDLATRIRNPEQSVEAPTGERTTFQGVIVHVRRKEFRRSVSLKMRIKVTTERGVWYAWGTFPVALHASNARGRISPEAHSDAQLEAFKARLCASLPR